MGRRTIHGVGLVLELIKIKLSLAERFSREGLFRISLVWMWAAVGAGLARQR